MERMSLEAAKRKEGKGGASAARRNGMIPGVLYGKGYEPACVAVNEKLLEQAVSTQAGVNVLLDLKVEGADKVVARIRDYQADPIKRNFTHIDFQVVDLKQKIMVEVPILFEGKAKGVKEGGVLLMDRRVLTVKCLPLAIPKNIAVDINELDIGDSIHVNELKLPEGVECPHEGNFSIVSVVAPMKEEVAAPVAAEGVPVEGAAAAVAGAAPAATPAGGAAATAAGGVSAKPGAAPGAAPAAGGMSAKPGAAAGSAPAKGKK